MELVLVSHTSTSECSGMGGGAAYGGNPRPLDGRDGQKASSSQLRSPWSEARRRANPSRPLR
ncbi:hypothetical protein DAI22_11g206501 [Oryza sativa Japonica Group]|nr:hypothetical protein DAI22_11g206501 [Oryza sativa Japonica Group]